jgi:hypothetical protein
VDATMSGVPRLICPLSFIGSPPGADFDNSFGWSIGAVYAVAPPFSVFAFLDGSTAIRGGPGRPLGTARWRRVPAHQGLEADGLSHEGLSDGSADWGVSAGLALRF